jgi:hypothetical protein
LLNKFKEDTSKQTDIRKKIEDIKGELNKEIENLKNKLKLWK